jgi:hypothetical protein
MSQNQHDTLNALKLELQFIERGGYEPSVRDPRKELRVFQDSPSCLNYALPTPEHQCEDCWLIDFVPSGSRREAVPCHHIPLNARGDTVASLGGPGDKPEIAAALQSWLRKQIAELEVATA